MSKTKAASRLLSSLLAILMVFCLFPMKEVQAADPVPVDYTYIRYYGGDSFSYDYIKEVLPTKVAVENVPGEATPGTTLEIPLPTQLSFRDEEEEIEVSFSHIYVYQVGATQIFSQEVYPKEGETSVSVDIPETVTGTIRIVYRWGVDWLGYIHQVNGEMTITNMVDSLTRDVYQDNQVLTAQSVNDIDTYVLSSGSKEDLVLDYSATMDMTNLGSNIFGAYSWDMLQSNKHNILDDSEIDLHFQLSEYLDVANADLSGLTLESDMFCLQEGNEYSIEGQEIIVHCRWDSASAMATATLDPIIYLSGISVPIKETWTGTSVTIQNHGYVDGIAVMKISGTNVAAIDGGEKDDTFILTLPKPQPPEESSESSEEPEEPSTIIPDNGPTLSIRKVWVEDTEEDRPDSILVEIYHDEELYDTIEVEEKYRWRASYDIPERYEDDDWWVQEADVPAGYEDYIDETRDNVFVITNTYVGVEEESSEESSEPSVTPSEPSVTPSEPSSEPSEPVSEPSEPAEPTLPQTGQVWWPIIILLAGGAVLVAFGAFRTIRGNGRRER